MVELQKNGGKNAMTGRRARRAFSEEQKKQLVELFNNEKPRSEIIREYDLMASAFDKWVKQINTTGSCHENDNRATVELKNACTL
jgi:transposase